MRLRTPSSRDVAGAIALLDTVHDTAATITSDRVLVMVDEVPLYPRGLAIARGVDADGNRVAFVGEARVLVGIDKAMTASGGQAVPASVARWAFL